MNEFKPVPINPGDLEHFKAREMTIEAACKHVGISPAALAAAEAARGIRAEGYAQAVLRQGIVERR